MSFVLWTRSCTLSRNFTDGAPRRRVVVFTDSLLEDRIDLASAGRVREDAIEDMDPARLRVVRGGEGGVARLLLEVAVVAVVMVVAEEKEMVYKSRFTDDLLRRQTPH